MERRLGLKIIMVLLILPVLSNANPTPDSKTRSILLRQLDTIKGPGKVDVLNQLSFNEVYTNTGEAIDFANEALHLSKQLQYTAGESVALNRLGVAYDVKGDYANALSYYHEALSISKQINEPKLIASNLSNIGLTHWHIGNSNDACKYLFSALTYFEAENNIQGQANVNNNIGMIYKSMRNYDKALVFFQKALSFYQLLNNKGGIGAVLTNSGQIYTINRDFSKALSYLNKSVKIKEEIDDLYGLSISYNHLATLFMEEGNYDKALQFAFKAVECAKKTNSNHNLAESYLKVTIINIRRGNFTEAIKFNRKSEALANNVSSNKLLYEVYHNYADIYEATGEYRKSLAFYKKFKNTEDSVINNHRFNKIYELELKHETEKSEMEIELLRRQKRFQVLQIEAQELLISKRNTQIILTVTVCLAIILLLYIFYISYRQRYKQKLEKTLHRIRELRAIELLDAEFRERKRIGEELHDGLGQILSVLKLTLTSLDRKLLLEQSKQQELLFSAICLTDNAFSELRNISHNLAPILLHEKGLASSIRSLLEPLQEAKKFKLNMDFSDVYVNIDGFIELTIYRVVQEVINNIIVHSKATEINFQLLENDDEIMLMIEDNGKGFDINKKNGNGIGLKNIQSRIESIGGNVHIDTAIGRGTIVTILIPVKQLQNGKIQAFAGG